MTLEEKDLVIMTLKSDITQKTNDLMALDTQINQVAAEIKDTKKDNTRKEFEEALVRVLNMARNSGEGARTIGFWATVLPQSQKVFAWIFQNIEVAVDSLMKERAVLLSNIQELETRLEQMVEEQKYLGKQRRTETSEAKVLILELKERGEYLEKELGRVSGKLREELQNMEMKIKEVELERKDVIERLECAERQVAKLKALVDVKVNQLKAKEAVNTELKKMADVKTKNIEILQKALDQQKVSIEALTADIQTKESTIEILMNDSKTKDTRIETLSNQIEKGEKRICELEGKTNQLAAATVVQRDTIETLRMQAHEKTTTLGVTEARVASLLASTEKLSSDNFELEAQASKQSCQVLTLQSQIRALKSKVGKLQQSGPGVQMLYIESFTPGVQPIGVTPEYAQTIIGDVLRLLKAYCSATADGDKGGRRFMDPSQVSVFSLPLVVEKLLVAVAAVAISSVTDEGGVIKKKRRVVKTVGWSKNEGMQNHEKEKEGGNVGGR